MKLSPLRIFSFIIDVTLIVFGLNQETPMLVMGIFLLGCDLMLLRLERKESQAMPLKHPAVEQAPRS